MLHQTCVFASGGICRSRSAFRCIRGAKRRHAILHAWVGLVRILENRNGSCYAELMFLHPVGSTGHVVHCGAYGAQNVDAPFFLLVWDRYGYHKKCAGTRYTKPISLLPVGYAGQVHLGRETTTHYFACSGGTSTNSKKSAIGDVTSNLCFFIWWDIWVT
jgi:hypothetical protein